MVGILRRTPIFGELVKRFAAGQSVIQVADWVYESKPKGLGGVSYGTLRVTLLCEPASTTVSLSENNAFRSGPRTEGCRSVSDDGTGRYRQTNDRASMVKPR
jgi:hypothetical protein